MTALHSGAPSVPGEYRIPGCNDADADLKRPAPQGQRCSLPSRVRGCARTAWHSHTIARTLYVTEGQGLVQARGEAVTRIRPGNVVNVDGGEWHWHGAAPDRVMTHLSLTEGDTEWGAHVTDAEYGQTPA